MAGFAGGDRSNLVMGVFISLLVLAGLWPPFVCGEQESKQSPICLPPHPVIFWSGPIAQPSFDFQNHSIPAGNDEFLVFVVVQGDNKAPSANRVALLSGNKVKAEAETSSGIVVFFGKGDLFKEKNLLIRVVTFEVNEFQIFGCCGWDGSRSGCFRCFIPPERVEISILSPEKSKTTELPGFLSKAVTTSKECPVKKRIYLDLLLREKYDEFEKLTAGTAEKEFRSRALSLPCCRSEADTIWPQSVARSLWFPSQRRPNLTWNWKLLGADQTLGAETIEVRPADWRKGTPGDSFNPGLHDQCRLLLRLAEQEPEEIIILTYPEPKKSEPDDAFRYLNGLTIGGVSITF